MLSASGVPVTFSIAEKVSVAAPVVVPSPSRLATMTAPARAPSPL
jgi:hypothetical protein